MNPGRKESRLGFTLLELPLYDFTKNHEREPQNHEARNEVAQVAPWKDPPPWGARFWICEAGKAVRLHTFETPSRGFENRGPAEGGGGEETSPRTTGSNTPTKVDGLSTYPFSLGLTLGHFHPRPSFG